MDDDPLDEVVRNPDIDLGHIVWVLQLGPRKFPRRQRTEGASSGSVESDDVVHHIDAIDTFGTLVFNVRAL